MRTTVTLDSDVERLLRKQVRKTGASFKLVLNNAIRAGLRGNKEPPKPYHPITFDMGEPRVDLTKAASLAAELEDEELIRRYRQSR
ncbi:MAG: antitoxin [Proteobacteria bacterium]|nr:antitoxin [Pseudomonadota bacterium]